MLAPGKLRNCTTWPIGGDNNIVRALLEGRRRELREQDNDATASSRARVAASAARASLARELKRRSPSTGHYLRPTCGSAEDRRKLARPLEKPLSDFLVEFILEELMFASELAVASRVEPSVCRTLGRSIWQISARSGVDAC